MALLIVVSLSASADDDTSIRSSIRQQEATLATGLRTANRSILLKFTDSKMHILFQCSSANFFSTAISREDWIDTVVQVRPPAYDAKVGEIRTLGPRGSKDKDLATASIAETIDLRTSHGLIEKRLFAWDTWVIRDGMWKLASRNYLQVCDDSPHLSFP
jgi:hypothetical protein